jgi:hypothetical protein
VETEAGWFEIGAQLRIGDNGVKLLSFYLLFSILSLSSYFSTGFYFFIHLRSIATMAVDNPAVSVPEAAVQSLPFHEMQARP